MWIPRLSALLLTALLVNSSGCQAVDPSSLLKAPSASLSADPMPFLDEEAFPDVPRRKVTIRGEMRNALLSKPPSRFQTEVVLPQSAYLEFGVGVLRTSPDAYRHGIHFEATLTTREGRTEILFSQYLNPAHNVLDRGWVSRRIDLSAFSEKRVELAFTTKIPDGSRSPAVEADGEDYEYAAWGHPKIRVPSEGPPANVVLISIDTLRADHLGSYGYFRNTSPFIDAWAKEGVRFENAFAQAPWTTPSHMSLFTSLYPSAHSVNQDIQRVMGFVETGEGNVRTLSEDIETLAEILRSSGYETAAFTGGTTMAGPLGFAQGFDRYNENLSALNEWVFGGVTGWVHGKGGGLDRRAFLISPSIVTFLRGTSGNASLSRKGMGSAEGEVLTAG